MDSFKLSKEQYCDLMKLDRVNAVNLFLYLLSEADDEGTLIVSIRKISSELCIGLQTVRTLLGKMYLTHQLTHQLTRKSRLKNARKNLQKSSSLIWKNMAEKC